MHQSPQKQVATRRDRNAIYAVFEVADDDLERRPLRGGGQPKSRKAESRDEGPRQERSGHKHPRG
jgi:hypothetical protein